MFFISLIDWYVQSIDLETDSFIFSNSCNFALTDDIRVCFRFFGGLYFMRLLVSFRWWNMLNTKNGKEDEERKFVCSFSRLNENKNNRTNNNNKNNQNINKNQNNNKNNSSNNNNNDNYKDILRKWSNLNKNYKQSHSWNRVCSVVYDYYLYGVMEHCTVSLSSPSRFISNYLCLCNWIHIYIVYSLLLFGNKIKLRNVMDK